MSVSRVSSSQQVRIAVALALGLSGAAAFADDAAIATGAASEQPLEQVIVTGTRRAERTVLESNVPIDVVSSQDLQKTATADINGKLQALVP